MPFSILMSVYRNDKREYVEETIKSIWDNQTLKPDEIVLVVDGPIPEDLASYVQELSANDSIKVYWQKENQGLGKTMANGVLKCTNEIIARMDSDDIALPDRFEKQIAYMEAHPDCDVVGGQITEFIDSESNIVGKREVPCTYDEILTWLKGRCPFNHVSVIMSRSRVIAVGNYLDWHFNEDYYLWIRMAEAGCRFANLPDTLVNVRVGKEMYARRGGWKYFKSEKGLQDYMLSHKIISFPRYCYNVFGRFLIQVAMPNKLRGFVFQKLFRQH